MRLTKKALAEILGRGEVKIAKRSKHTSAPPKSSPRPASAATRQADELLERFERLWNLYDGPQLETEYRFHPKRRWRADYCHVATKTLIELEGGIYSGGRHTRGQGYRNDCEKYNAATMLGYRVIRLATGMVQPAEIEQLVRWLQADC